VVICYDLGKVDNRFAGKYRTETIRLAGWDYSQSGFYFVTICTKDRMCYLGNIVGGEMRLLRIGEIVRGYWLEIPEHFGGVFLDEFIVMPSHFHGIVTIGKFGCRDVACNVSTPTPPTLRRGRSGHCKALASPLARA